MLQPHAVLMGNAAARGLMSMWFQFILVNLILIFDLGLWCPYVPMVVITAAASFLMRGESNINPW